MHKMLYLLSHAVEIDLCVCIKNTVQPPIKDTSHKDKGSCPNS